MYKNGQFVLPPTFMVQWAPDEQDDLARGIERLTANVEKAYCRLRLCSVDEKEFENIRYFLSSVQALRLLVYGKHRARGELVSMAVVVHTSSWKCRHRWQKLHVEASSVLYQVLRLDDRHDRRKHVFGTLVCAAMGLLYSYYLFGGV